MLAEKLNLQRSAAKAIIDIYAYNTQNKSSIELTWRCILFFQNIF